MKIGNSTIQFNTSINSRQFNTRNIADVPYWSLYARKGDCISDNWQSYRAMTYDEIVTYLTNYKGHRVLEAFPRRTRNRRRVIEYKNNNEYFVMIDKHTHEILLMYNTKRKEIIIISPDYKSPNWLLRKMKEYIKWRELIR